MSWPGAEMDETEYGAVTAAAQTVDRLARIETKLDGIKDDRTKLRADLDELERRTGERLDRVERFMWLAVGMAFASGVPDAIRTFATVAS